MGPWLVTPDELADPDDLALGCSVDGETVQDARTSDLVFGVPSSIAELSAVLPLLPGDVIFTGTPAGVGFTRQPPAVPPARQTCSRPGSRASARSATGASENYEFGSFDLHYAGQMTQIRGAASTVPSCELTSAMGSGSSWTSSDPHWLLTSTSSASVLHFLFCMVGPASTIR